MRFFELHSPREDRVSVSFKVPLALGAPQKQIESPCVRYRAGGICRINVEVEDHPEVQTPCSGDFIGEATPIRDYGLGEAGQFLVLSSMGVSGPFVSCFVGFEAEVGAMRHDDEDVSVLYFLACFIRHVGLLFTDWSGGLRLANAVYQPI